MRNEFSKSTETIVSIDEGVKYIDNAGELDAIESGSSGMPYNGCSQSLIKLMHP